MRSIVVQNQKESFEKTIVMTILTPKYFLLCESCFWCASYCDFYYDDYGKVLRSKDIIATRSVSCPTCGTNKAVKSLPLSIKNRTNFLKQEITTNQ